MLLEESGASVRVRFNERIPLSQVHQDLESTESCSRLARWQGLEP